MLLDTLQTIQRNCALNSRNLRGIGVFVAASIALGACQPTETPRPDAAGSTTVTYACGEQGYLSANLYGAITGPLQWDAAELACDGMPRPDGQGARLRFAGTEGEQHIAIIIAIPGLKRGTTGIEIATNVTLIEEGGGRFFSTADLDNCWTDVTSLEPIDDSDDRVTIGGTLYCVLPLAEVNGDSSLSIPELEFQGMLDWNAS